ncbi:MAG: DNA polymerase I [Bordetella sp.]|nr:MAG: DNA polymerase I [Bordetella sp.]
MKQTLLLVDGSSYLYRAFYAMPNLRNSQGQPTGAIYGVLNMLRKLSAQYKTNYGACIFDTGGKSFRDDIFFSYKSNRPPMPPDLVSQVEPIYQAVKMLGWPVLRKKGIEADDIIGTLSKLAIESNFDTIIFTCDKDLCQLVNNKVTIINTMSDEILTESNVLKKYGVIPSRIVEYLMLAGDKTDNIPGVNKVGPITAAKWLNQFGSIDNLLVSAKDIQGVLGENLRAAIPMFSLTRQLLTIKCDLNLNEFFHNINELKFNLLNLNKFIRFCENYGFYKWIKELKNIKNPKQEIQKNFLKDYFIIDNYKDLFDLKKELENSNLIALSTEISLFQDRNSILEAKLVGLSIASITGKSFYIPLAHYYCESKNIQVSKKEILSVLQPWLENPKKSKILYDAKKSIHVLKNEGIDLAGIAEDIMLKAYILDPHHNVAIGDLSKKFLSLDIDSDDFYTFYKSKIVNNFDQISIKEASYYSTKFVEIVLQLYQQLSFENIFDKKLEKIYKLEMEISKILIYIERTGVKIDISMLSTHSQNLNKKMLNIKNRIYELAKIHFNLNSTKELAEILFHKLKLSPAHKTRKGTLSTNEESLKQLALIHPLPKLILDYRGLAKIKSTYADKLPKLVNLETNRIHTNYSQISAITGRLTSSYPNLQNIPVRSEEGKHVRKSFIAEEKFFFVSADYSQIELRIMAHLSKDINLINAFQTNKDIHKITASEVFQTSIDNVTLEQRRMAKTINFGLIYGMGSSKLSYNLKISRTSAKEYIDRYFSHYHGVSKFIKRIKIIAREQGYLETIFGRRLELKKIHENHKFYQTSAAERAAVNAPMQGSAADLIKKAMIEIYHWLKIKKMKTKIIMQVHDELLLETPEFELEIIKNNLPVLMCNVANLLVPLVTKIQIGKNWGEIK